MKKSLSILSLSILLAACGGQETTPAPKAEEQTQTQTTSAPAKREGKTYMVATESSNPPFVTRDGNGQISGFEYDLLEAIAEKKGFNLTFIPKSWNEMFASLDSDSVDIITSNISITPERQQKYDFVTPHFESGSYVLQKSGNKVSTWKDLANKNVAVQTDTLQQDLLNKYNLKHSAYDSAWAGVKPVLSGEQDAFVADKGVILYFHNQYKNESSVSALPDEDGKADLIGIAVKKGNTDLLNILNDGMKQIRADGTYDKIYNKWLGSDDGAPSADAAK
ncbi:substrate-binding periplasmic protein [Wielerella bovis]|uniref:substrate-binding periplasmic protein n=1 Tax=Wielerella bovis TaxID=2917790 RepID=UPI002019DA96|nr:transporter substrate-binding domain-containing protein [Wielerella bovis]ULJ63362.1 transporter substrate-binding domain-containing protein [Wielerella bovis]ULJ65530.1 transporter substrate-binding domain-containing protein [Wielerella bovis]ULJ66426.1 transporter substrate-binding domain-containing protein [Wielerella bovis]